MNTFDRERMPYPERETAIARDLQLNLKRLLSESSLADEERYLTLLALGASLGAKGLSNYAREQLQGLGVSAELQQEAEESAAMMAMLNMYYRFRHMLKDGNPANSEDAAYQTAGLRMTSLARPLLGKERFEQLAFAVSVLNGCQNCVVAHEDALRKLGVAPTKIHDLAKLAAVAKAISTLAETYR